MAFLPRFQAPLLIKFYFSTADFLTCPGRCDAPTPRDFLDLYQSWNTTWPRQHWDFIQQVVDIDFVWSRCYGSRGWWVGGCWLLCVGISEPVSLASVEMESDFTGHLFSWPTPVHKHGVTFTNDYDDCLDCWLKLHEWNHRSSPWVRNMRTPGYAACVSVWVTRDPPSWSVELVGYFKLVRLSSLRDGV